MNLRVANLAVKSQFTPACLDRRVVVNIGSVKLNPHLSFSGQCEAAFRFYERCLGGKCVTMLTYGDSPMTEQVPPGWSGKIVHATLTAGDVVLMGGDVLPEQYERPKGFAVILRMEDPREAER